MPILNWNDTSTLYYFFSTSSQAVAAISGLFGTFLIFRYQYLQSVVAQKEEHIGVGFSLRGGNSFNRAFYTDGEREQYDDFVTASQRVAWVKKRFQKFWTNGDDADFKATYQAIEGKNQNWQANFDKAKRQLKGWHLEIKYVERLKKMQRSVQRIAIGLTTAGLSISAVGAAMILWVESFKTGSGLAQGASCAVICFGVATLAYLGGVVWGTVQAFQNSDDKE